MKSSLAFLCAAGLVVAGCDEQLASIGGNVDTTQGVSGVCAALVAAQTGVPTETVLIGARGMTDYNMTAQVPGSSTPWICEVRGGDTIVGVYPAGQKSRNVILTRGNETAPVYRVASPQSGTVTTSVPRRVSSPNFVLAAQQSAPLAVAPRTYVVSPSASVGQTEYRSLTPTTQARTVTAITQQARALNPAVAEPSYLQPLYSETSVGPKQVGNRIVYTVPSPNGISF